MVNEPGEGVGNVIASYPKSQLMRWRLERQEDIYHSSKLEPLGKSMNRGHVLPQGMGEEVPFGRPVGAVEKSKANEALKIIFPAESSGGAPEADAASIEHQQYVLTHGDYYPGEQRRRGYDWAAANIDPATHSFGMAAPEKHTDGVAKALNPTLDGKGLNATIVSKRIEDFKLADADELGRCKTLGCHGAGRPDDAHTFGMPSRRSGTKEWSVGELIVGDYSIEEQMPDANLGKSLRRGFRNVGGEDRSYGVPSIRTDIPAPSTRSVADVRNYGNEPNASHLLYTGDNPNVAEEDYLQVLDKDAMKELFEGSGIDVPNFDEVFAAAESMDGQAAGHCSVDSFRRCVLKMS